MKKVGCFLLVFAFISFVGASGQAEKSEKKALTNADVVNMVKAGLGESTIVLAIQHSASDFDTSPQALITLKNEGVPQKILDAMLTAGGEKKTTANVVAQEPSARMDIGKWETREEVSPIDGTRTVYLDLEAEQSVPGLNDLPMLVIRCKSPETDVFIRTGSLPSESDRAGKFLVRLRLDDGQPLTQFWGESSSYDSLFSPDPVGLAKQLGVAKKFAFEFTPMGLGAVATWFDVTGLQGVLGKVAEACKWSNGGTSGESTPPDLHSIRTVFLEIDFDGEDRARSIVEKHTCLQVVTRQGVGDATLIWSASVGGANLKLLDKDRNILWSKRSLAPPFGALNKAVGCQK